MAYIEIVLLRADKECPQPMLRVVNECSDDVLLTATAVNHLFPTNKLCFNKLQLKSFMYLLIWNHLKKKRFSYFNETLSYGPHRHKTCLREFANNKGADQPAHPRRLISTFVIRLMENIST